MDKLGRFRQVIRDKLCGLADFINQHARDRGFSANAVIDEEHDQYLLVKTGWNHRRRVHGTTLYLRIVDDKIWIEEDWTEDGICDELVEAGVSEADIVLASQSPEPKTLADVAPVAAFHPDSD